jgi:hypothetical protein
VVGGGALCQDFWHNALLLIIKSSLPSLFSLSLRLVFVVAEIPMSPSSVSTWSCGWRNVMMIVRRPTGFTATQRSAQNATLPSRKMAAAITWCAQHARQSSAGSAKVPGSHMDLAGQWWTHLLAGIDYFGSLFLSRYKCNRYNEKDSQNARDTLAVSILWSCVNCMVSLWCHFPSRNPELRWRDTCSIVIATWIIWRAREWNTRLVML